MFIYNNAYNNKLFKLHLFCVNHRFHGKFLDDLSVSSENTKNYSKELMCDELSTHDWTPVYGSTDVNYAWTCMKNIILSSFDKLAPVIKKRIREKPSPWLTDELKLRKQ